VRKVAEGKLFKGGEFLITDAQPEEVFTPEDFTKEQRMIAKSAEEFGVGEIDPRGDELEEVNPELIKTLLRKAGELGFLLGDMPEIYGDSLWPTVCRQVLGVSPLCSSGHRSKKRNISQNWPAER
jgi:alkylation response protein AidB-like acyl-CoA dehydrogenase